MVDSITHIADEMITMIGCTYSSVFSSKRLHNTLCSAVMQSGMQLIAEALAVAGAMHVQTRQRPWLWQVQCTCRQDKDSRCVACMLLWNVEGIGNFDMF
jgi:hypothetical protein